MLRYLLPIAALAALGIGLAWAQTVFDPQPVAAACSYNATRQWQLQEHSS